MISVGIDVSKGKSTVCFFKPGGEVLVTPFEVAHTKGELNELADKINSYGEEVLSIRSVLRMARRYTSRLTPCRSCGR